MHQGTELPYMDMLNYKRNNLNKIKLETFVPYKFTQI